MVELEYVSSLSRQLETVLNPLHVGPALSCCTVATERRTAEQRASLGYAVDDMKGPFRWLVEAKLFLRAGQEIQLQQTVRPQPVPT